MKRQLWDAAGDKWEASRKDKVGGGSGQRVKLISLINQLISITKLISTTIKALTPTAHFRL